jgi:hypothetical protein
MQHVCAMIGFGSQFAPQEAHAITYIQELTQLMHFTSELIEECILYVMSDSLSIKTNLIDSFIR